MSLTLAAIGAVVTTIVKYLIASRSVQIAGEKAMEKVGEASGEAVVNVGQHTYKDIKQVLLKRGDKVKKANKALSDLEEDPNDEDYQHKLTAELEKLSSDDAELRELLERYHTMTQQAYTQVRGDIQGTVNVSDQGKIFGPSVGTNTGNISIGSYHFDEKDTNV